MKRLVLSCGFLVGIGLSGPGWSAPDPIEGDWLIVSATIGGKPVPPEKTAGRVMHLEAGRFTSREDSGDYVLVPGKRPAAVDMHGENIPNSLRTILAIYQVSGDDPTIDYDLTGRERPVRFESRPDAFQYLVHYRRVKP